MSLIGVAAASYEGSLFSWKGNYTKNEDEETCLSSSGKYMACGGTDERIRIFNMVENSTLGELSTHTGAVTCLQFFEDSYLLSGSDDNSICIWRTHDWMCVHILGGHKASINSISVHPSGKLAVSVAQDNTLKVWNLVQGRIAFTRRLKGSANIVKWLNPSGASYMLVIGNRIEVYSTDDNSCTTVIESASRVNQADFFGQNENIISICEDKFLRIFDKRGQLMARVSFSSLKTRIRDFSHLKLTVYDNETQAAALATSCGRILLVNLDNIDIDTQQHSPDEEVSETPLQQILVDTFEIKAEPRLTCITAWVQGEKKIPGKKVRKNKSKTKKPRAVLLRKTMIVNFLKKGRIETLKVLILARGCAFRVIMLQKMK